MIYYVMIYLVAFSMEISDYAQLNVDDHFSCIKVNKGSLNVYIYIYSHIYTY